MKKKVPHLKTDKQAEAFLARDLSKLDFSQFKAARFEFEKKDDQINMRVPKQLLLKRSESAGKSAWNPLHTLHSRRRSEQAMATPK